jgi:hypothetical protein
MQAQLKEIQQQQEKKTETVEKKEDCKIPERRRSLRKSLSSVPPLDTILKGTDNGLI